MNIIKYLAIIILAMILIMFPACNTDNDAPIKKPEYNDNNKNDNEGNNIDDKEKTEQTIDYDKVRPNELGEIMVLMYHNFGHEEKDEWWRSFDNFRKDLQLLYDEGYRLISMQDFMDNKINIPAGKTPVVFTFDDASFGQFNLIEINGKLELNPESAVGIMKDFCDKNPDFGFEATFYINDVAFSGSKGTEKERLEYLIGLGLDIGNHTFGHTSLANTDPQVIQSAIGKNVKRIMSYFPDYKLKTLALPNGEYNSSTFDYIVSGKYDDITYRNDAILLVGWKPSPPSVHKDYYPLKMLRVRASEGDDYDMYYYLDFFNKNPDKKYISDGNVNTICFPEGWEQYLNNEKVGNMEIITY